MELSNIKKNIEDKTINDSSIIFISSENCFVFDQYVKEISKIKNKKIQYVFDIEQLYDNDLMFSDDSNIKIYKCDELLEIDENIKSQKNTYVCCKKIDKEIKDKLSDIVCEIPKLEQWQIKDYAYEQLNGLKEKKIDFLLSICNYDIYRLQNEIDKLKLFPNIDYTFDTFAKDDIFSDLSSYTVFNLTNAIVKRDINTIKNILYDVDNIDINEIGFITILFNNFKNVIDIQLSKNPTPESTGMKQNQFNAVRYNCGFYTKEQLIKIINFISDLDYKIKSGIVDISNILCYTICNILSM